LNSITVILESENNSICDYYESNKVIKVANLKKLVIMIFIFYGEEMSKMMPFLNGLLSSNKKREFFAYFSSKI
jgi:hypothetical protein